MKITNKQLNDIKISLNISFPKTMEILNNIKGINNEDYLLSILELQKYHSVVQDMKHYVIEGHFIDRDGDYVNELIR